MSMKESLYRSTLKYCKDKYHAVTHPHNTDPQLLCLHNLHYKGSGSSNSSALQSVQLGTVLSAGDLSLSSSPLPCAFNMTQNILLLFFFLTIQVYFLLSCSMTAVITVDVELSRTAANYSQYCTWTHPDMEAAAWLMSSSYCTSVSGHRYRADGAGSETFWFHM